MASGLTPAIVEAKLCSNEFAIVAKTVISELWLSMGVGTKDGEDLPYVACKTCFKAFRFLSHKTGTIHLKRHIEDCKDRSGKPGRISQPKLCFPTVRLPEQAKKKVVEAAVQLVANDIRPFSILDGKGMRTFCQTLLDVGATYGKVDANALLPVVLSFHCFHYSIVIIYSCIYTNCDHVMLRLLLKEHVFNSLFIFSYAPSLQCNMVSGV